MTPHDKKTQNDEFYFIDRVAAEIERSTAHDSPSPQAVDATILALQKLHNAPELVQKELDNTPLNSSARLNQGRNERMLRLFRYSGLAAAVMILVAGFVIFSQTNQNTALAFEQAKQKALSAKSVSYDCTIETIGMGSKNVERHFIQGDLHRRESRTSTTFLKGEDNHVTSIDILIDNHKAQESLELQEYVFEKTKTAKKWKWSKKPTEKSSMDRMLGFPSQDVERVGEEKIDGRTAILYNGKKLVQPKAGENQFVTDVAKFWIDAETGYMLRGQIEIVVANVQRTKVILENFKWNEPIDEKLFSFDVPEGYKLIATNDSQLNKDVITVFGQIVENIKKATSVVYTQNTVIDGKPVIAMKVSARGDWVRMEYTHPDENVTVENSKTGEWWTIVPSSKIVIQSKQKKTADKPENLLQQLTSITDMKSAIKIKEETLDGKKAILYHVTDEKIKGIVAKVWVDPATNLPLKSSFESSLTDPQSGEKRTVVGTVEQFVWNVPLKKELFEVPIGYRVIVEPDESKVQTIIDKESKKKPATFIETDGQCEIEIVDADGKPLLDAEIFAILTLKEHGWEKRQELRYTTKSTHKAVLLVQQETTFLKIWIHKAHYVPLFTYWGGPYLKDNPKLPKTLKFVMQKGTRIGGIVQDEQGRPIEGAQIEVHYLQSTPSTGQITTSSVLVDDEIGMAGPMTDAKGRWSLDNVPPGEKTKLQLKISHPDFPGDKSWDDVSAKPELTLENLRTEKAVYVMKKKVADRKASEDKKVGN